METLPALLKNQLAVLDDVSFEQHLLQAKVRELSTEAQNEFQLLEGAQAKLKTVVMFMAFHNRDVMSHLDDLIGEIARLQGLPEPNRYEPVSPEEMLSNQNTPKEPEGKKKAYGWTELECKKVFRFISSKCHPDRTRDQNLRDFMPFANDFYTQRDLECLQMIKTEVESYIKLRKNRGQLREIFQRKTQELKNRVNTWRSQRERILNSKSWTVVTAYEEGFLERAKNIHRELVYEQITDHKVKLAQIKGQMRMAAGNPVRLHDVPLPDFLNSLKTS